MHNWNGTCGYHNTNTVWYYKIKNNEIKSLLTYFLRFLNELCLNKNKQEKKKKLDDSVMQLSTNILDDLTGSHFSALFASVRTNCMKLQHHFVLQESKLCKT